MTEQKSEWSGEKVFGFVVCCITIAIFLILFVIFAMDNISPYGDITEHTKTIMRWTMGIDLILLIGMGLGALAALPVEKK